MSADKIGNAKKTSLKYGRFALKCLPSAAVTLILVAIIYCIKGIWPFGDNTVAYMDMWQANVPTYYHLYDFLHGSKSLLYDWYTGLGINMSETTAISGLLSPFNLLFYFTSRNGIMKFVSIFTLVKFMAMSFSMSAFLNYKFGKLDKFWITLFSVAYSLCGFSVMYYTNSQWLDSAALFPLLLITLDRLYTHRKVLPYVIMLTLYLVTNAYTGIITLLFLFVAAGLYISLMVEKGKRGGMVINLGAGTFAAIGISAFLLLPFYAQTTNSARLSGDLWSTIVAAYNYKSDSFDIQKLWMLWGTALAFAIIVTGIIRFRKERRTVAYTIGIIVSVTIQIICENINLLWHGGSYVWFTMRFGFITAFVLWGAAAYYLCRLCGSRDLSHLFSGLLSEPDGKLYAIGCAILCAGISGGLAFAISNILISQPQDNMRITSIIIFALVFALFLLMFNKPVPKVIVGCLCSVMIAELLAGGYLYIGKPYIDPHFRNSEPDQTYTETLGTIREFDGLYKSEIDRIKNSDTSVLTNYPFLLQRAAISNWTHTIPATRQQTIKNLGYSTIYTRMVDGGGTIFSDALMNIKQVFTSQMLSDDAYTFIGDTAGSNIYNCNYTLPLSVTFPSEFFTEYKATIDPIFNQRSIAEALGADGLVNIIIYNDAINDEFVQKTVKDNVAEYTVTVSGTQQLYLYSTSTMNVAINGETLVYPNNGNNANINYPASYNNGIFDLGSFTDETVVVTLTYSDPAKMKSTIAMMDHSLMNDLCSKYSGIETNASVNGRTLSLNVTCPEDGRMLFLPVAYDEGLSCKVNGQPTEITPVFGDLVAVPVGKGDSTVSLHFTPKGFDIGVIISLVSLALVVTASVISRLKKPKVNGGVLTAANVVFMIIWIAMSVFVYIAPILYSIYKLFV